MLLQNNTCHYGSEVDQKPLQLRNLCRLEFSCWEKATRSWEVSQSSVECYRAQLKNLEADLLQAEIRK